MSGTNHDAHVINFESEPGGHMCRLLYRLGLSLTQPQLVKIATVQNQFSLGSMYYPWRRCL